jgi:alkylation response protein AidB-like acyl-CoA dehydrogenase
LKIPQLTDIQRLSIDSMRTFVQQDVKPNESLLRFGTPSREQVLELTQAVAEFGLPGIAVPKAFGGSGMDWVIQARLFEELVKGSVELATVVLVNMVAVELLMSQPALCGQYLPDLLAGRSIAGLGSMLADTVQGKALHAQRKGGHLLLNGNIEAVTNGQWADFLISTATLDKHESCFVLLDKRRDRYETRLVFRDNYVVNARVQVTGTHLSEDFRLGETGAGSQLSRRLLDFLRLHEGIARVAQGQGILDAALAEQTNPITAPKPTAGEQLISLHLAEMITQLESARLMCHHGLVLAQDGQDCEMESSMARFLAQGAVERVERHAAWVQGCEGERRPSTPLHLRPLASGRAGADVRSIVSHWVR